MIGQMIAQLAQLARYGGVGLIVYAIDYGTFWLIATFVPAQFLLANIAGKAMGAATGFVLHKRFTFAGQQQHRTGRQALLYAAVLTVNMVGSSALLWLAAHLSLPIKPSRIAIDALTIAVAFLAGRFVVFRAA
jgi:putative flippase GtrA